MATPTTLTAADIMTGNPVSIRNWMSVKLVAAFLLDNGFSAAPVVNEAGKAIGVVSLADIARYEREQINFVKREVYQSASRKLPSGEHVGEGFQIEEVPNAVVDDIMTPLVFTVSPTTKIENIIKMLLEKNVHRMYVADDSSTIIGVITSLDILRRL
jgi:predicted transcriptional regulator